MVAKLSEQDISIGLLLQLDKLVHLIESPVFIQLRMQLMASHSRGFSDLLRTLYGLLMILPQGEAYKVLSSRLHACSALQAHLGPSPPNYPNVPTVAHSSSTFSLEKLMMNDGGSKKVDKSPKQAMTPYTKPVILDVAELVDYFVAIQGGNAVATLKAQRLSGGNILEENSLSSNGNSDTLQSNLNLRLSFEN